MKKVTILVLLMVFNIGPAASDLIFQDGFESGWPNAWAQTVGWSPFFVKDSTGALVGPVVGWQMGGETGGPHGIPLVAALIDGEKVIFKVFQDRLSVDRKLLFSGADCEGQAYLCTVQQYCGAAPGDVAALNVAKLRGVTFALDHNNVLYRAAPPIAPESPANSLVYEFHPDHPDGPTCVNRSEFLAREAWAAQPVVDLDTLFTPPFTVE